MPVEPMTPEAGLLHTRAGIAAVRDVLASVDLDAPVPACPGWTLRDLGSHVGNVHRWVVGALAEGHPNTPVVDAPSGREALLAWYDDGAAALVDLLAGTDPGAPCWTFGTRPRTARFWFRRQAHEHAVHAYDARTAGGATAPGAATSGAATSGAAASIDPVLAADGIDEVVTMFFPRQVRLGRTAPLTRSLAVATPDGGRWVLAGDGTEGLTLADAEVVGPVEAGYLLLWNRVTLDDPRLTVTGDPAAARSVLASAIVP